MFDTTTTTSPLRTEFFTIEENNSLLTSSVSLLSAPMALEVVALPVVTIAATDGIAGETLAGLPSNAGLFTFTRTGDLTNSLTANYGLSGTASNGVDFDLLTGMVAFAAGSATTTVTINPLDDVASESSETVILTLLANNAYSLGTAKTATVKILDNDAPYVSVAATDASAGETATGVTPNPGVFTLTRLGDLTNSLTVNYLLSGTAVNGTDYANLGNSVTFAAGLATAVVKINPIDDAIYEGNETVILTLSSGITYNLGTTAKGTITLLDNDKPTITITATDADAGESNNPGQFTLTRSGNNSAALTVNYTIAGTATNGSDYNLPSSVTFAAGSAIATITVQPLDDLTAESSETIILSLLADTAYNVGTESTATVTIWDDDTPVITVEATDAIAGESENPGIFTFTRLGNLADALTVNYALSGTAVNGTDYNFLPTTVTFAAGSATSVVNLNPINDVASESTETIILDLLPNAGYNLGTSISATVSLLDNDVPYISLAVTDGSAAETATGVTPNPGSFTLTRIGDLSNALTINYLLSGTATSTEDFPWPTTLGFAAGEATVVVNIAPIDDAIFEGSETVVLTLTSGSTYNLGTAIKGTVTIADNDKPTIAISATDADAGEGNNPGQFTLTRSGNNSKALTVNYVISGTAVNGTDYSTLAKSVTFAAGSSTATVTVNPTEDLLAERGETVILALSASSLYNLAAEKTATVIIADNEAPVVTIAATDASAGETAAGIMANPGVFTLTRLGSLANELTINYAISGTAINGTDYNTLPTAVTFAAGSSTATVTVNPLDDVTSERSETVILTLLADSAYGLGTVKTATVTILDNDAQIVTIAATDASAGETAAGVTPNPGVFTLTRLGNLANALTVNYVISGTAVNGTDYNTLPTAVTFAAGAATATVTVNPINDGLLEPDEKVTLTLSAGTLYNLGSAKAATVTIKDNTAIVSIAANGSQIGESSYTYNGHTYLLTTTPKTWEEAQVEAQQYGGNLVTINDAAEEQWLKTTFGTDRYFLIGLTDKASEGNFVWASGEPVTYTNWNLNEPNNLGGEHYGMMNGPGWNDLPLWSQLYGIIEIPKIAGQFTLTRVGSTSTALTVNYTVSGTATNGTDYTSLGGTVTFTEGSSTATINVNSLPDNVLEDSESVVITLEPSNTYQLGTATTANLAIVDNTTYPTQSYLKFDGVDDQFVIADQDAIDFDTNQNFTVEVWFKADPTQVGGNSILEKWWSGNGPEGYPFIIRYHHDTGIVYAGRYDVTNNPVVQSTTTVNDNKWHHLAFIKDGKTLRLYIDGNEEASSGITDTTVNTTKNPSPIYVGSRGPNSEHFAGGIDDLRIWNVARTQAEIQANFKRELQGNESGLVGYWKLNGTVNDWTSNQNHGSLKNNPTWQSDRLNTVTISANDADVSETNNPGQFTLTRTGDLTNSLTVNYSVAGTATNGTDYSALNGITTFAAGSATTTININPIDDSVYELNETVTLTLISTNTYNITNANSATVSITNNDIEHLGLITDFNKDGKTDIIWRYLRNNPDSAIHAWAMDGANSLGGIDIQDQNDPAWYVVGTGDFNNDGNDDLLLRYHWWDNTGNNLIWLMNGNQHIGSVVVDRVADDNWHIVGTGDFNKDGNIDILWRNIAGGQNVVWTMQGTTRTGGIDIEGWGDLNERIVATGDFNGDANVDILWRNFATGNNTIWFMNGLSVTSKAAVTPVGLDWHIMGASDFNNDGKSDIIWRNFNGGQNTVWLMNGSNYIGEIDIPDVPDRNWTMIGKSDPVAIWTVDYFGNKDLAGAPTYTEVVTNIHSGSFSRNWGTGAPPNTPADYFSARMRTDQYFAPGTYKINLSSDNGVRLWIGGELIINQWGDTLGNHVNYFTSSGGYYSVTIEYQEYVGLANINFSFAPGSPPPPVIWDKPVTSYWISQRFTGSTFYTNHTGIDLAANRGTRVEAAKNGTVIRAGWDTTGYGNLVVVDHGDDFRTYYAHLDSITVGVGQVVDINTQLGTVGSTGNSTGPHLHFETRLNGVPQNPENYIAF